MASADEEQSWIGKTVSHYEVLEKLGGGGMGVVYKARDLRLDRFVALKFLSPHLGDSGEARQRFIHEARAASALDHPNIVTLYEIGETGDGHLFLSLAFYDGETLKKQIERGPLKIEVALDYACQVASGLARAHAEGIVHRDVKPANLLVSRQGQVKIVDFGLAKLASQTRLTQAGLALGTSGYMSPEQLRGEEVNHRTDIWALGVVLHEMITGRLPFRGDSPGAIAHAILYIDPEPMTALRTGVPLELDRIVLKMLAKNPADRYQHVDEIPVDLRAVRKTSGSATSAMATTLAAPAAVMAPARPPTRRRGRTAVLLAVALLAIAGAALWTGRFLTQRSLPRHPSFRYFDAGSSVVRHARFTPDGQSFVYDATSGAEPTRIFLARSNDPVSMPATLQTAVLLSVSATGEAAILVQEDPAVPDFFPGTLARVPLLGGGRRKILREVLSADWSPDGSDLAILRQAGSVCRLEFPIGRVLQEMSDAGELRFAPDGKRIAFLDRPVEEDDRGSVAVVDLQGKKRVLSDGWFSLTGLAWSPGGDEVWFTGSKTDNFAYSLQAVDLQGKERTLLSAPSPLTLLDVSRQGRVLLARGETNQEAYTWSAGQAGVREIGWLGNAVPTDLSPDGKTVLVTYYRTSSYFVQLRPVDGSPAIQLGEGASQGFSPDGKWVAALVYGPPARLILYPADLGSGARTLALPFSVSYAQWFPDGKRLALQGEEPGHGARCYELPLAGGRPRPMTPEGTFCGGRQTLISPDGRWLIGFAGKDRLLYPTAGGPPRKLLPHQAWEFVARWHADGKGVFLVSPMPPWRIYLGDVTTGERRLWKELAIPERPGALQVSSFVLSQDGTTGVQSFIRTRSYLYLAEGLQ
ncbi:MAG: protein kinase domain-containing protein [Thermoanaerobaculia bacterium]